MSQFSRYPGAGSWAGIPTYYNLAAFPDTAPDGALAVALDTDSLYIFDGATATWLLLSSGASVTLTIGTIDSETPSTNGAVIDGLSLVMQSASATRPGLVNTATQTMAGAKTFSGALTAASTLDVAGVTTTAALVDIVAATSTGCLRLSNVTTNATTKRGMIIGRTYTNADGNFLGLDIQGANGANTIVYGGGSGTWNAATNHNFYAAANTTTTTGTSIMAMDLTSTRISTALGIGAAPVTSSQVSITSPATATGTAAINGTSTVTGTGTKFLTEFHLNDSITIAGETKIINALTSDTSLTVSVAFAGTASGEAITRAATPDFYIYPNGNFQHGGTRTTATMFASANPRLLIVSDPAQGAAATSVASPIQYIVGYSGGTTGTNAIPTVGGVKARGSEASPAVVQSGDGLFQLDFRGYDGGATSAGTGARIQGLATETFSATARGTQLIFQTVANTTASLGTALTIDQDKSSSFDGVVRVGAAQPGGSPVKCLAIGNQTLGSATADMVQITSKDLTSGNTMLAIRTEGTPVSAAVATVSTDKIAIEVNGTTYYLLATTVA